MDEKYTTADNTVQVIQPMIVRGGYGTDRESVAKVLEATAKGDGEIILKENYGKVVGGSRKYPTTEYSVVKACVITDKDYSKAPESIGINWDNVKTVSGATYGIGPLVKEKGFAWNKAKSVWERK